MGSSVLFWDFQVTLVVRTHLPMQEAYEMQVRSLSREDPLEEGMATHSSILAWRIPMDRGAGGLQSMRLHRVRHDCSDLARSTVLFLLYFFFPLPPHPHLLPQTYRIHDKASSPALEKGKEFLLPST